MGLTGAIATQRAALMAIRAVDLAMANTPSLKKMRRFQDAGWPTWLVRHGWISPTAGRRAVVVVRAAPYHSPPARAIAACRSTGLRTSRESACITRRRRWRPRRAPADGWSTSVAATQPDRLPLFLARSCSDVHIVIRGQTLASSMSRYLIERIEQ